MFTNRVSYRVCDKEQESRHAGYSGTFQKKGISTLEIESLGERALSLK
jgi:hypothetical protein